MENYFSIHNLYYFIAYVLIFFAFGLLTGSFSKDVRESKKIKQSIITLLSLAILFHTGTHFLSKYFYNENKKICSENINNGYKMQGSKCYMPLKSGEYVQADSPTFKL